MKHPRKYPLAMPVNRDPRFCVGLALEVARVLEARGYPKIEQGLDVAALTEALLSFLYARSAR